MASTESPKESSKLQALKACCCFGCCAGKKLTVSNGLLVARGVFGTIAMIHVLITFILLGAQMDAANFPGSNLVLAEYSAETSAVYTDADREGQYVQKLDGFILADTPSCSNFLKHGSVGLITATGNETSNACKASKEEAKDNDILPAGWNQGWAVVQDCKRSNTNPSECAPFGSSNALSVFGQLTFAVLAVQVILFTAHTCVSVYEQAKEGKTGSTVAILKAAGAKIQVTLGLTITWCIVGVILFAASLEAWVAFCDKIDTGLGRMIDSGTRACATSMCTYSFGSLFATITFAVVWYRIPHLLTWCGVLEAV